MVIGGQEFIKVVNGSSSRTSRRPGEELEGAACMRMQTARQDRDNQEGSGGRCPSLGRGQQRWSDCRKRQAVFYLGFRELL